MKEISKRFVTVLLTLAVIFAFTPFVGSMTGDINSYGETNIYNALVMSPVSCDFGKFTDVTGQQVLQERSKTITIKNNGGVPFTVEIVPNSDIHYLPYTEHDLTIAPGKTLTMEICPLEPYSLGAYDCSGTFRLRATGTYGKEDLVAVPYKFSIIRHTHDVSDTDWEHSSSQHWKVCEYANCEEKVNTASHDKKTIKNQKEATPSVPGSTGDVYCSVCGYKVSSGKKVTVSGSKYTWTGSNRSPSVKVYDGSKQLTKGTDYTISMAKNHHTVGKYTITVNMTGKYAGSTKTVFQIIPKGTKLTGVTAGSKKFTAKWNKQSTKMSSSVIDGYQLQWSTSSTFASNNHTKKVKGYSKTSFTIDKSVWSSIQGGKKYYVRIRTYKTTGSGTYYSTWSDKLTVTTKK